MSQIKVVEHLCPQNHHCPIISVCPKGAITQRSPYQAPVIDQSKCTNCGLCANFCAFGAFQMN